MPTRAFVIVACLLLGACASSGFHNAQLTSNMPVPAITDPAADPYSVGKAYLRTGRLGLAIESFRVALRDDPDSVDALNGLAIAYDQLGRFDVARATYDRALRIDPDSTETLNNLARSLLRQSQTTAALVYLERARATSPSNATVLANLRAAGGDTTGTRPVPLAAADEKPAAEAGPRIVKTAWRVSALVTRDLPPEPAEPPLEPGQAYRPADPPLPIAARPVGPADVPEAPPVALVHAEISEAQPVALADADDVNSGGHLVRLVAREAEDLPPHSTLGQLALSAPEPDAYWRPTRARTVDRLAALIVAPRPRAILDPPLPRPWAMLAPPHPRPWTVLDPPPPKPLIVLAQG